MKIFYHNFYDNYVYIIWDIVDIKFLIEGFLMIAIVFFCVCDSSDFGPLVDTLGLFFQIRDDYANLMSEEVMTINYICTL